MAPLTIHFRCFVQSPFVEWSLEQLFTQIHAGRQAGFDEIIIDANFWDRIARPDDWLTALDELAPALEVG